jgi:AraC-like DNA-binding protein
MDYILAIGIFEAFVLSLLLWLKHQHSVSDKMLALFFAFQGLTMVSAFFEFYNRQHNFPYPYFLFTTAPMLILHGPLLWLYIKSLTDQHFRLKPLYLLHLLPFAVFMAQNYAVFFRFDMTTRIAIIKTESFVAHPMFLPMTMFIATVPVVYCIWGLWLVKRYNAKLKVYFSHLNDIDLNWLRLLLLVSLVFYAVISYGFAMLVHHKLATFGHLQMVSFSFSFFYLLILGLYGHRQINLFASRAIEINLEAVPQPAKASTRLDDHEKQFVDKLLAVMEQQKPFLEPELTLSQLADAVAGKPEYLSEVLNTRLNQNFYDFINHYRINEFKHRCLMPEHKNLTLIAIAFDCGFNSKATFNRVFKKVTGLTPSQFAAKSQ